MAKFTILLYSFTVCFFKEVISFSDIEAVPHTKIDLESTNTPITNVLNDSINMTRNKLKLKVYYETLCPGSIDFFVKRLGPLVESLPSNIDVVLIPYGHATTRFVDGVLFFECQHGHAECYGNTIHACAIDVIGAGARAVVFNACLMQYTTSRRKDGFTSALDVCGDKYQVAVEDILECADGSWGTTLLKLYGVKTKRLSPRHVPYVTLEGDAKEQLPRSIKRAVCGMVDRPSPLCKVV